MSLYLLVEEEYIASSWCNKILEGLSTEKKRKKTKITQINDVSEAVSKNDSEKSSIIIIGSRQNWLAKNIDLTYDAGLNPIVICNTQQSGIYAKYSSVSSDVFGAIADAMDLCVTNGHKKIALYGINPDSTPDAIRKNAFLTFGGNKENIYYNKGLLKNCFYSFLPNSNQYDAILCANEFAAVSLVNNFKKENIPIDDFYIISCTDSVLCKYFSPSITSYSINFKAFGRAALSIHETLIKNESITTLNTLVNYELKIGETTPNLNYSFKTQPSYSKDIEQNINIYNDPELSEMIAVETILKTYEKDPLDLNIIKMLIDKNSLEQISEATFLSVSAIKYRLRNLCKSLGASSTGEMLKIILKYFKV